MSRSMVFGPEVVFAEPLRGLDDEEHTLEWMIANQPEWAASRMREGNRIIEARNATIQSLWNEVNRLRTEYAEAVRIIKQGKAQFAPHTTNSDVDVFLARAENTKSWLGDKPFENIKVKI